MNTIGENIYEGIKPSGVTSIQGWNSTKGLFAELIERVRPATIIEVGTWLGASAIHMAGICRSLGLPTKIYCVDTWLGAGEFWNENWNKPTHDLRLKNGYPSVYYEFLANVVQHGFEDTIIPVPNTSFIGSCIFRHRHILADLIYIDGSHAYEDVKSDIAAYRELLAPGGVMFGDDIGWHEVKRAVSESIPNHLERENFWVMP